MVIFHQGRAYFYKTSFTTIILRIVAKVRTPMRDGKYMKLQNSHIRELTCPPMQCGYTLDEVALWFISHCHFKKQKLIDTQSMREKLGAWKLKGVFSIPSGKCIVVPNLCFWVRDFKFWLLAYFLIFFNYAKFQKDWTNLILDIL